MELIEKLNKCVREGIELDAASLGYALGERNMYSWLRASMYWHYGHVLPFQRHVDSGLFRVETVTDEAGIPRERCVITPKGISHLTREYMTDKVKDKAKDKDELIDSPLTPEDIMQYLDFFNTKESGKPPKGINTTAREVKLKHGMGLAEWKGICEQLIAKGRLVPDALMTSSYYRRDI